MLDEHTHSWYSMDSEAKTEDMVLRAIDLGLDYLAVTNHYNADFNYIKEQYIEASWEVKYPFDMVGHIEELRALREKYKDKLMLAVGVECGYSKASNSTYLDTINREDFDIIVNSIHLVDHEDIYREIFYENKDRDYVFRSYLEAVRESVDAPYDYDIIGHIGYISRRAPYENNLLTLEEYGDEIDDILRAIISRDKCLECNTKTKSLPLDFLPGREILARYYELGGRKVSFGSDAHNPTRIADKYKRTAEILEEIGFEGFTYYIEGKPHLMKW